MGLNLNVYSICSSSSVKISAQCLETHSVKLAACIYTVKKYSKKKHFIHLWNLRYRENWKLRNFDVVSFCGIVQIIIFQSAIYITPLMSNIFLHEIVDSDGYEYEYEKLNFSRINLSALQIMLLSIGALYSNKFKYTKLEY